MLNGLDKFLLFVALPAVVIASLLEAIVLARVRSYDWRASAVSLFDLFARYQQSPDDLPAEWVEGTERESEAERARRIGNFIAGMTDRFALTEHQRLFDSTPDLR